MVIGFERLDMRADFVNVGLESWRDVLFGRFVFCEALTDEDPTKVMSASSFFSLSVTVLSGLEFRQMRLLILAIVNLAVAGLCAAAVPPSEREALVQGFLFSEYLMCRWTSTTGVMVFTGSLQRIGRMEIHAKINGNQMIF